MRQLPFARALLRLTGAVCVLHLLVLGDTLLAGPVPAELDAVTPDAMARRRLRPLPIMLRVVLQLAPAQGPRHRRHTR